MLSCVSLYVALVSLFLDLDHHAEEVHHREGEATLEAEVEADLPELEAAETGV